MDFFAHLPEPAGQQQLDLRVDVLDVVLEFESPGLYFGGNLREPFVEHAIIVLREQPYAAEHLYVRPGTAHVIARQTQVQHTVIPHCKGVHARFRLSAFIPQCCHTDSLLCRCISSRREQFRRGSQIRLYGGSAPTLQGRA